MAKHGHFHFSITTVLRACWASLISPWHNGRQIADDIFKWKFWMKSFVFWFEFHWSLFLRVQLTIIQHWFRWWLGDELLKTMEIKQILENGYQELWVKFNTFIQLKILSYMPGPNFMIISLILYGSCGLLEKIWATRDEWSLHSPFKWCSEGPYSTALF